MRVLLHICCAVCACYPIQCLRSEGHEVRGLFFNPNIHPYQEFRRRLEALRILAEHWEIPVIFMEDYPLEEFLRRVAFREGQRCRICYQWRMEVASQVARRGRYDAFTSTLLFSKFQNHEKIAEIAEEESRRRGVPFLYEDFRKGWREGQETARSLGLYRQQYCGCIFSEKERFSPRSSDELR